MLEIIKYFVLYSANPYKIVTYYPRDDLYDEIVLGVIKSI